jgi:hypothetical protein
MKRSLAGLDTGCVAGPFRVALFLSRLRSAIAAEQFGTALFHLGLRVLPRRRERMKCSTVLALPVVGDCCGLWLFSTAKAASQPTANIQTSSSI